MVIYKVHTPVAPPPLPPRSHPNLSNRIVEHDAQRAQFRISCTDTERSAHAHADVTLAVVEAWRILPPHQLAIAYAQPSRALAKRDMARLHKLCEISNVFLHDRFAQCIRRRLEEPCLLSYSADSTPLKTREDIITKSEGVRVLRRGGKGGSYNIQRLWFLSGRDRRVLFAEPVLLQDGKTWSHYECYKRLGVSLRELGARDICIEHDVADRARAAPLHRLLLQHHALVIQRISRGLDEGEQTKLRLTSWHVHTSCAAHDVHKACEWGFLRWLEKDARQNAFLCIESLRSSYAQLARNVIPWIQTVVAYADWEYPFKYELWVMIGFDDSVIDLVLSLGLRWD